MALWDGPEAGGVPCGAADKGSAGCVGSECGAVVLSVGFTSRGRYCGMWVVQG
jgi:hypothetical protein